MARFNNSASLRNVLFILMLLPIGAGCQAVNDAAASLQSSANEIINGRGVIEGGAQTPAKRERDAVFQWDDPAAAGSASYSLKITVLPPVVITNEGNALAESASPLPAAGEATVSTLEANKFSVDLKNMEKNFAEQKEQQWCWAACAQMVLARHRISVPGVDVRKGDSIQKALANYYKGKSEDQTANLTTIMRAMNPDLERTIFNNIASVGMSLRGMHSDRMIEELTAGNPVVIGMTEDGAGHACVVIGAKYCKVRRGALVEALDSVGNAAKALGGSNNQSNNSNVNNKSSGNNNNNNNNSSQGASKTRSIDELTGDGDYAIQDITIFDPWPGEGVKTISAAKLKATCDFIMSRALAREILLQPKNAQAKSSTFKIGG